VQVFDAIVSARVDAAIASGAAPASSSGRGGARRRRARARRAAEASVLAAMSPSSAAPWMEAPRVEVRRRSFLKLPRNTVSTVLFHEEWSSAIPMKNRMASPPTHAMKTDAPIC